MGKGMENRSYEKLLKLATTASVATAAVLICVKLGAWFFTGSLSVLASLVDSLMDAAASAINLLAVRYSLKSADEDHGFGHGKAEYLAGLGQASFIAGSALFLIFQAFERLSNPEVLEEVGVGIGVMIFAVGATLSLLAIQRYVIIKTNSTAIKADALHYKADLLTNAGTIIALFLVQAGWQLADPVFALLIAGYILSSAWQIGYEAIQLLMDRQLPLETRDQICKIALDHSKVIGIHDLRTRQSGQTFIIQMHIEMDDQMPLLEAHAIAKDVENDILNTYPQADIIIHQDPTAVIKKTHLDPACIENSFEDPF
jgi:ferrous-iron efflux pump FieF